MGADYLRVAIDTGGTFTDCVYFADGRAPGAQGVLHSRPILRWRCSKLWRRLEPAQAIDVRHGTTVGTNTMLERKGARVAFVTTAGFEDTIAIGRQTRSRLYDWFAPAPDCLVPRELRFGVPERVSAEGEILRSPTDDELATLVDRVRAQRRRGGCHFVAFLLCAIRRRNFAWKRRCDVSAFRSPARIAFCPSFANMSGHRPPSSMRILRPGCRAISPHLEQRVAAQHSGGRVDVMQSSGGIIPARLAAREPVRTVLSGPAGGVIGACQMARWAGFERIIGFDMGGTSTDVFLADSTAGGARLTRESVVAGVPIGVPMLDIHTAGAGGGSIARFDAGGMLRVGPESAGAEPGPICFGRGNHAHGYRRQSCAWAVSIRRASLVEACS